MTRFGAIVITGATGWVGRTLLEHLVLKLSPLDFGRRVRAFASRSGSLRLSNQRSIAVQPLPLLPEFAKSEAIESLLHAAFLTPDRCDEIGLDVYSEINYSITRHVCESLRFRPTARVVLFSSGAAALAAVSPQQLVDGSPLQCYGQLKLQEERSLCALNPTLVLRIYGLTGRFIREPSRYALGDFLCHASRKESIVIKSPRKVMRGYVAASDLSALSWEWLQSSDEAPSVPLEALAETVDLLSLAEMISSIYDLPSVRFSINSALSPDVYSASPERFLTLLKCYGLMPTSLEQQIRDTYAGIMPQPFC